MGPSTFRFPTNLEIDSRRSSSTTKPHGLAREGSLAHLAPLLPISGPVQGIALDRWVQFGAEWLTSLMIARLLCLARIRVKKEKIEKPHRMPMRM